MAFAENKFKNESDLTNGLKPDFKL